MQTTESSRMIDQTPLRLRAEDDVTSSEDRAPITPSVEIVQPRRVRSQLAALDSHLLGLQDDAESLFAHVTSRAARETLRRLYSGLEEGQGRLQRILNAVERGA